MYYSQLGQDKIIDEIFNFSNDKFFVEVGAHDGVSCSNTLFFEETRQWKGICIEPSPKNFAKLVQNRKSININSCVSNFEGEVNFANIVGYSEMLSGIIDHYDQRHINRINNELAQYGGSAEIIKVQSVKLQTIFNLFNVKNVDFCSIDTEGSELEVLNSIDFNKTKIKCFSIENNFNTDDVKNFLESKGYNLFVRLSFEDIYTLEKI
jgi:FkbM family methyltransferase